MNRFKPGVIVASLSLLLLGTALGCKPKTEETVNTETPPPAVETPAAAVTPAAGPAASATLQGAPEDTDFTGTVTVTAEGSGVRIVADLSGVDKDGLHGFHVHETGECSHGDAGGKHFSSAGGHFNPGAADHACPPTSPRHAGDLGNIQVTGGKGHLDITSTDLSLIGPNSIVGKAIIVHAGEDDCKTQPTGNAGDRLACGVVTASGASGSGNK